MDVFVYIVEIYFFILHKYLPWNFLIHISVHPPSKKLIVFSYHLEYGIKILINQGAGFDVYLFTIMTQEKPLIGRSFVYRLKDQAPLKPYSNLEFCLCPRLLLLRSNWFNIFHLAANRIQLLTRNTIYSQNNFF